MLSLQNTYILCYLLDLGCHLQLFPYQWDPTKKRVLPLLKSQLSIFQAHSLIMATMTAFSMYRFLQVQYISGDEFPLSLKIMNSGWIGIYSLATIGLYQFGRHGEEIRTLVNWLLKYVEDQQAAPKGENICINIYINLIKIFHRWIILVQKRPKSREEIAQEKRLTRYLTFGISLFAITPAAHAILVYESPCAPHFSSSLYFPCSGFPNGTGKTYHLLEKIPFIMIEYYLTTVIFTTISFNWALLFLGISWILYELKKLE